MLEFLKYCKTILTRFYFFNLFHVDVIFIDSVNPVPTVYRDYRMCGQSVNETDMHEKDLGFDKTCFSSIGARFSVILY